MFVVSNVSRTLSVLVIDRRLGEAALVVTPEIVSGQEVAAVVLLVRSHLQQREGVVVSPLRVESPLIIF